VVPRSASPSSSRARPLLTCVSRGSLRASCIQFASRWRGGQAFLARGALVRGRAKDKACADHAEARRSEGAAGRRGGWREAGRGGDRGWVRKRRGGAGRERRIVVRGGAGAWRERDRQCRQRRKHREQRRELERDAERRAERRADRSGYRRFAASGTT